MRGRKPKPTEQQITAGDPARKGVHKLDQKLAAQPKAERGLPECPEYLQGAARIAWDFWRDALDSMNLDYKPDALTLESGCLAYHELRDAYDSLNREGRTRMDDKGKEYNNPAVTRMTTALTALRGFTSEFGLSPVSRTRLTIEKGGSEEKDMMNLLSQPRAKKDRAVQ
jgi:P27 family predicted phage terminase small subunit